MCLVGIKRRVLIFPFEIDFTGERLQEAGKRKDLDGK